MVIKRTAVIIAAIVFISATVSAAIKTAGYTGADHTVSLKYDDTCFPGDAVFVRMTLTAAQGHKKVAATTRADIVIRSKKKRVDSADFFVVKNAANGVEMLAGVPLSSFLAPDDYSMKITYAFMSEEEMEFELPLKVEKKDFEEEIIPLDKANTAIKTDNSVERNNQIKKLNSILETVNESGVFQMSPFVKPVETNRRTSGFADRRTYQYAGGGKSTSLHYGIDFGVPEGTPVSSCAAGKVVMAENRVTTGWSVVIEHLPGLYSLYYHMNALQVKAGQTVKQKDVIGLSGATGLATGPHLHWEVRLNSAACNPDFFTGDFAFDNTYQ